MLPCSRCVQGSDGTGATAMAAFDMLRPTCNQPYVSQRSAHLTVIGMPRTSYQVGQDADHLAHIFRRPQHQGGLPSSRDPSIRLANSCCTAVCTAQANG